MITGMSRYPELDDERWLREHYVDERMSAGEVARLLGCTKTPVLQALRRSGVQARSSQEAARTRVGMSRDVASRLDDERWLRVMYLDLGRSTRQIAETLGCDYHNVMRAIDRAGIETRDSAAATRRHFGVSDETARRLDDADWMREAYVGQMRPVVNIAAELGVSFSAVKGSLDRHGIDRRGNRDARRAHNRATVNGYDAQRRRRLLTLAKDAGAVGRAYTQVIKLLGDLDRVPYSGREAQRFEREAMDGLHRAEQALIQRLMLGSSDT